MNPGETFDVVIEIPRGSRNKYEYDHEQHVIRLDRRLFSATVYPADYGFVPDTLALDGDPLDVLVLLEDPTFPGCWVEVRAVGVFWMEDEKGPDAKILCVPQHDPIYEEVHDLERAAARACSTRSSTSSTSTRCWSRRRTRPPAATRAARRRTARSRRRGCGSRARRRDRRVQQLVVAAGLDDPPVVDHHDAIGGAGGLQAVRDEQRGAVARRPGPSPVALVPRC